MTPHRSPHHARKEVDRSQHRGGFCVNRSASTRATKVFKSVKTPLKVAFTLTTVPPSLSAAPHIAAPSDVVTLLGAEMGALVQEQLRVLLLDTKLRVRACHLIYQGTVNSAHIRVAEVLRPAVIANLPEIVLVHNHPSGDTTPSPEDIRSTQQIAAAAELFDIELLDHVILGVGGRYYSLKEDGLLRQPTHAALAQSAA